MKPHKHAELIKAWADGAVLQKRYICGAIGEIYLWEIFDGDWSYCADYEFRIKPESKPDRYKCYLAFEGRLYQKGEQHPFGGKGVVMPNLRLTFDGETGELKSAEVLK